MTLRALAAALVLLVPAAATAQVAPRGSGSLQIPIPELQPGTPGAGPIGMTADVDILSDRLAREAHRGHQTAADTGPAAQLLSPLRPVRARGTATGTALRFDGERRALDFVMQVPDPQRMRTMRIATLSSINVLPERSSYRVFLNDVEIGAGILSNVTQTGTQDFTVPAGVARGGVNRVRIELVQYHRIYCGPDASFALWTDIDLAQSGGILDGDGLAEGPEAFILGLAATAATGAGLEIRGAEALGDQRDAWVGAVTQRMAAAMGGDPIPFRFTRTWSVVADRPPRARVTFLPSANPEVRFATGGDGAQVMIIGVPPGSGPVPLPDFESIFQIPPRLAEVPVIPTRQPVPLSAMGFTSLELRDRYSFTEVPFRLPDDYVILTNQKSEMTLTYIYADDLPYGSVLQIYINGTNIRVLPLQGEAGRVIEDFPVRFEARHLRGGLNEIGFEVMVPGDPADLPCPHRDAPVVAISDRTTILAPYSPSMYLPDMHFAFTALSPRSVASSDLVGRAFSALDVLTLRAALSTGQRVDAGAVNARLNLIAFEDLGAMPLGGYQFSRRAIEAVLEPPVPTRADSTEGGQPAPPYASLFRAEDRREGAGMMADAWDWVVRNATAAGHWMHPHSGLLLESWLTQQRGQAVLFQLDPQRPDQIWLLRAPTADANAIAAALVAARGGADGPRGQVSVLGHDGRWSNWVAPDREPVLLESITLGNLRHVLGNFVSAMPVRYVTGLFFLALISAVFALRLVISTREH